MKLREILIDMKVLAVIPARSGSKGFPGKNIAKINGVTLIEYAVFLAKSNVNCYETLISTDSEEYEAIAVRAGARSLGLRPLKLAQDESKTVDVVLDLLQTINTVPDWVLLLQPTSPVRAPKDLDDIIELAKQNPDINGIVSVTRLCEPHPYKLKTLSNDMYVSSFIPNTSSEIPRQMLPEVYALNGAFYLIRYDALRKYESFLPPKTLGYKMNNFVNIDTEEDYWFLRFLVDQGRVSLYND